jgi:hypothetical protein
MKVRRLIKRSLGMTVWSAKNEPVSFIFSSALILKFQLDFISVLLN